MRVDKYLWHVRLFKTRSISTEACRKNQIRINGNTSKASSEVKIGDTVTVRRMQIDFKYNVLGMPKSRIGAKLVAENLENITTPDQLERLEQMRASRTMYINQYREGRPTKKDHRDMVEYVEDWDDFFDQEEEETS